MVTWSSVTTSEPDKLNEKASVCWLFLWARVTNSEQTCCLQRARRIIKAKKNRRPKPAVFTVT
ncbi:hypothetical protein BN134_1970 [Cronobacter dublinensis 1210]|uniref:Uncharacterized protein n=1 Tax=Cronobacter dublinensis 1210 TaxID=1208656 RepID=A0ABM9Q6X8_9ENTR|nr:hypothetical protein BN134_1970 [Cronobacter dublinensis 1210]